MFLLLQHGEHVGTVCCAKTRERSIRQSLFHAVPATTERSPRARELKKQAPLNLPNDDRSRPNDVERVRTRPNARSRKPPAFREKINSRAFKNHRRSSRASIARTFITVRIPHANKASSRLVCSKAPMHKNLSITSTMGSHRVGPFRTGGPPPFPESLLVDSPPFIPPGSLVAFVAHGRRWCPQVSHVVPGACSCPHAAHIGDDPDSLCDRRIGRRPSSPESESDVAGARVILWCIRPSIHPFIIVKSREMVCG